MTPEAEAEEPLLFHNDRQKSRGAGALTLRSETHVVEERGQRRRTGRYGNRPTAMEKDL